MEILIIVCEDSVDGIFTGIYHAWEMKHGHDKTKLEVEHQGTMELFATYVRIDTDPEKSEKVARTLRRRLGQETYEMIYAAALSEDVARADAIYHTVVLALAMDDGSRVMNVLTNPAVRKTFDLYRQVGNEAHHLLGFIRFRELKNGVLYSQIHPKGQALTMVAPHFADRLGQENWMIYDANHGSIVVHRAGGGWFLLTDDEFDEQGMSDVSDEELFFEDLWKGFCKSISIRERENRNLQKQNLPLRFRPDVVEFRE